MYNVNTMDEIKLKKLQTILKEINEGITRQEFVDSFKQVIAVVKSIKGSNEQEWKLIHEAMQRIPDKMMSEMMSSMSATEKKMVKDCMDKCEKMCAEMDKKHSQEMAKMQLEVGMIKADREMIIEDALDRVPVPEKETAEQVIEKINTSSEQIDKERIKGLEDEIKTLRKEIATKASAGVRRVFQPYVDDFSAQTNGSLKVFALSRAPLRTNTIQVFGTDFPTILRPTTDFTVSGKTLTLTSAVPAPSAGATLLIHYYA